MGAGAWIMTGALSRFSQGRTARLFHRRGLQDQALAWSHRVGITKWCDSRPEHRDGQLNLGEGPICRRKCFGAAAGQPIGKFVDRPRVGLLLSFMVAITTKTSLVTFAAKNPC